MKLQSKEKRIFLFQSENKMASFADTKEINRISCKHIVNVTTRIKIVTVAERS